MEQKEIVHRYYIVGTSTLDKVLQALSHLSMDGIQRLKDSQFPLKNEQNLYKLMNRNDPLTSAFLNEKVDLVKLKEHLNEQGLPFAFKTTSEGTNLYFRVKDTELAKKALERVITSIKSDPRKILRNPKQMTFEEKIAYAKSQTIYKGSIDASKTQKRGRSV